MQFIRALVVISIATMCQAAEAQGQGYYAQPNPIPGGFLRRGGRLTFGGSFGLGAMRDNGSGITDCDNCRNGLAVEGDIHVGGTITPQFALFFEYQFNGRVVHLNGYDSDTIIAQQAGLAAGQFWITPQLWVKGGLGIANLFAEENKFVVVDYGSGLAVLGAVGFEVWSSKYLGVEVEGRLINGAYHSGRDHITAASVGIGLSWYNVD